MTEFEYNNSKSLNQDKDKTLFVEVLQFMGKHKNRNLLKYCKLLIIYRILSF